MAFLPGFTTEPSGSKLACLKEIAIHTVIMICTVDLSIWNVLHSKDGKQRPLIVNAAAMLVLSSALCCFCKLPLLPLLLLLPLLASRSCSVERPLDQNCSCRRVVDAVFIRKFRTPPMFLKPGHGRFRCAGGILFARAPCFSAVPIWFAAETPLNTTRVRAFLTVRCCPRRKKLTRAVL